MEIQKTFALKLNNLVMGKNQ